MNQLFIIYFVFKQNYISSQLFYGYEFLVLFFLKKKVILCWTKGNKNIAIEDENEMKQ